MIKVQTQAKRNKKSMQKVTLLNFLIVVVKCAEIIMFSFFIPLSDMHMFWGGDFVQVKRGAWT